MSKHFDSTHVRRAFGRAAASYEAHAVLQAEVQQRLLERLDEHPLAPQRVLDVGAGTGRGTALLRKRYPKAQLVAIDLAMPMLVAARRHRTWLRPFARVCADAAALPFAEASIDLLHSNLCLQWCGGLDAVFDGFRRVLRPGGLVLFSTFGPETLHELRAAFAEVDAKPHVSRFLDMHPLGDALLAAGFRDPVLERDRFTLTYASALDLMRELRALGATNADPERERGLTGKGRLQKVIDAYEQFRQGDRLPATWEVVYAIARAPEPGQPRRSSDGAIASFPIERLRGTRRSTR
ncbi:MAG TPA: malonyl-ACP O-methyltransferase BioC [Dokdonella sp.]|uniref:malonyl-ACP O-methyltransferase BioC n=1 Tax=Dokdonella sp. TaxID=2291710 RepID=UPI0025BF1E60|nr:malonyl-ACP O-methyltransferase BioC [Dokdonella sp.]MBX3691430.1 malonyl-ACP O-methyltransferase BioC [Dokdonella sp.]MCW5567075.1 malonyl-ACP O-methyltransferase BioC [Dokdonella sp.]HNR90942.1 malonyl-ACP O-methyltransferase BioC [Dokdonella sp.]